MQIQTQSPPRAASPDQMRGALRALFMTFSAPSDRGEPGEMIATYLIACSGYPLLAIERAVTMFIRGEVAEHDGRFLPTAAELGRTVSKASLAMQPPGPPPRAFPRERKRDEPTPDEVARVKARLAKLKASMSAPTVHERRVDPIQAAFDEPDPEVAARALRAKYADSPMRLSDEAKAIFGRDRPTDADLAAYEARHPGKT